MSYTCPIKQFSNTSLCVWEKPIRLLLVKLKDFWKIDKNWAKTREEVNKNK